MYMLVINIHTGCTYIFALAALLLCIITVHTVACCVCTLYKVWHIVIIEWDMLVIINIVMIVALCVRST